MILGRDLLTELVLNLKLSEHIIEADDGPFKGSTTPMVDLDAFIFKDLNNLLVLTKIDITYHAQKL